MILGMGNFIIPFLVLLFTDKLGYSVTMAGTLAMSVTAAYLSGSFIGGKASDLFGHKLILVVGELCGALLILSCGFFPESKLTIPVLLFGAYFFVGIALPASNALIADLSTKNNRDAVMSLCYLAYNLGSALGPLIAGYLFWSHTQWIFWGNGLAMLIGALVVATLIKAGPIDSHLSDSVQERPVDGSVWTVLKARPHLLAFTFLCGLLWYSLNQMTMASPLYLSHIFGDSGAVIFGKLMTYACILVVVITPILMKLTSNMAETISLAYAGLMFAFGYGLVMIFPSIPVHFFAWIFLSAAEVLLLTKESVYLANHSPSSHRGRIQGVLVTLRSVLVMPSFVLIGFLIDSYGFDLTWLSVIGISMAASAGLYWMAIRSRKHDTMPVKYS
ncbi:MFS transporter [Bacterioplanes sanyensis]|uniref:MFS transporter n=1 Tax=Bacterioplanes sanyensis TaxID=1249553 RepID=A0A222FR64_9GAMM|nr:MFS transporter [Bacterioplanes sanyensis]ASP40986.1 MFS transporter [Bacterioplanes sanyensis]